VHKVHHLRETLPDDRVLQLLEKPLATLGIELEHVDADQAARHYCYDTPEAARIKFLLNVAIPPAESEWVLQEAFAHVEPDEHAFVKRIYMDAGQVAELEQRLGAVGAHSYAHAPLALLDRVALERDLARNVEALRSRPDARRGRSPTRTALRRP